MRLTDGNPLDPEVAPLCAALGAAGCTTVYSCGAHPDRVPPALRAYVTFAVRDTEWVAGLRAYLRAPAPPLARLRRALHFDCLLGRYTVAVWAPGGPGARRALDEALGALTDGIRARPRAAGGGASWCTVPEGGRPATVPCRLTLAEPPVTCGWTGAPLPPGC